MYGELWKYKGDENMAYYEDEIPKELIKGNTYTERQIMIFLENNEEALIISDYYTQLSKNSNRKATIHKVEEGFIHRMLGGTHSLPKDKTKIYYINEEEP